MPRGHLTPEHLETQYLRQFSAMSAADRRGRIVALTTMHELLEEGCTIERISEPQPAAMLPLHEDWVPDEGEPI